MKEKGGVESSGSRLEVGGRLGRDFLSFVRIAHTTVPQSMETDFAKLFDLLDTSAPMTSDNCMLPPRTTAGIGPSCCLLQSVMRVCPLIG
jgi:hypothetical protein